MKLIALLLSVFYIFKKKNNKIAYINSLFIKTLFVSVLSTSSIFALPVSKCLNLFSNSQSDLLTYGLSKQTLNQNFSQKLFSNLYEQITNIESFSVKEKQFFLTEVESTIKIIESSTNSPTLNLISPHFLKALEAVPAIIDFIKNNPNTALLDTKKVLQVVLVTFTKHTKAYLNPHQNTKKLDFARLNVILQSISNFNNQKNSFSLYKIIRTVKEKYSTNEYINCK